MNYVIISLLIVVALFFIITLGLMVASACPSDEEIKMWEILDEAEVNYQASQERLKQYKIREKQWEEHLKRVKEANEKNKKDKSLMYNI